MSARRLVPSRSSRWVLMTTREMSSAPSAKAAAGGGEGHAVTGVVDDRRREEPTEAPPQPRRGEGLDDSVPKGLHRPEDTNRPSARVGLDRPVRSWQSITHRLWKEMVIDGDRPRRG